MRVAIYNFLAGFEKRHRLFVSGFPKLPGDYLADCRGAENISRLYLSGRPLLLFILIYPYNRPQYFRTGDAMAIWGIPYQLGLYDLGVTHDSIRECQVHAVLLYI